MANTIAGVNLAAIAEDSLPALTSCFAPLNGVMTDFSADIASEGASVTTRVPTKPTAQDLSSGYSSTDVTLSAKTVTLDTFYGFCWGFTDVERSKSSLLLNDLFIAPALDAIGTKVFGDIWNLVVNANFSTSSTITAANFDRDDLVDLGVTLTDTKKAPKSGRTLWADPQHYGALVKTLNSAEFPGIIDAKAEAMVPRVAKFDCYETDLADANSENLAAFAFHRSSLLMAARGVDASGAAEAGVEVENITVPGLNLPVQFRRWYDPDAGELKYSVGVLYGVAVGNDMGARVVTA
jgi:hypothetical protein